MLFFYYVRGIQIPKCFSIFAGLNLVRMDPYGPLQFKCIVLYTYTSPVSFGMCGALLHGVQGYKTKLQCRFGCVRMCHSVFNLRRVWSEAPFTACTWKRDHERGHRLLLTWKRLFLCVSCWRLGPKLAAHSARPRGLGHSEGRADQRRAALPNQGIVSGEGVLESAN